MLYEQLQLQKQQQKDDGNMTIIHTRTCTAKK